MVAALQRSIPSHWRRSPATVPLPFTSLACFSVPVHSPKHSQRLEFTMHLRGCHAFLYGADRHVGWKARVCRTQDPPATPQTAHPISILNAMDSLRARCPTPRFCPASVRAHALPSTFVRYSLLIRYTTTAAANRK